MADFNEAVKRESPCKFTFRYKTMLFFWPGLVPAVKTMLFSKQDWEEATKIRGVWTGRQAFSDYLLSQEVGNQEPGPGRGWNASSAAPNSAGNSDQDRKLV